MTGTITVKEAAQVLGVDPQTVRVWLQQGLVSWGQAIKVKGSTQYNYVIYKIPFQNLTGYPGGERDGFKDSGFAICGDGASGHTT